MCRRAGEVELGGDGRQHRHHHVLHHLVAHAGAAAGREGLDRKVSVRKDRKVSVRKDGMFSVRKDRKVSIQDRKVSVRKDMKVVSRTGRSVSRARFRLYLEVGRLGEGSSGTLDFDR